ncbi:hypothetical protein LTR53_000046 [Teratosphaeriaceae sp. CCFEE 6253]|nr:hypothetical protein LTR53_000046 [Teratosphaeriaceae sp. CCFEE 6253]
MSATAAVPATCCGREGGCICAKEAKCSCGKQSALHCNCEKAQTENKMAGARCSCSESSPPIYYLPWRVAPDNLNGVHRCTHLNKLDKLEGFVADTYATDQRPAGECTCSRAQTENSGPKGSTCACGKRSAGEFRSPLPAGHAANE